VELCFAEQSFSVLLTAAWPRRRWTKMEMEQASPSTSPLPFNISNIGFVISSYLSQLVVPPFISLVRFLLLLKHILMLYPELPVPPASLRVCAGRCFVFTFLGPGPATSWSAITVPWPMPPTIFSHQRVLVGALCTSPGRQVGEP
jgi:hypothetical protein